MLIGDTEQFTMFFPRSESELNLGRKSVRLEAQGVLDVTLWLEGARHCLVGTVLTRPTWITFTGRAAKRSNAKAVFSTSVVDHAKSASLLNWHAARFRVTEQTRICEIVELRVMHNVSDAAVEGLAERRVAPLVLQWVKHLCRHSTDLKRSVNVQIFVEWRNSQSRPSLSLEREQSSNLKDFISIAVR